MKVFLNIKDSEPKEFLKILEELQFVRDVVVVDELSNLPPLSNKPKQLLEAELLLNKDWMKAKENAEWADL